MRDREGEREHKNSLKLQRSLLIFKYCAFYWENNDKEKSSEREMSEMKILEQNQTEPDEIFFSCWKFGGMKYWISNQD